MPIEVSFREWGYNYIQITYLLLIRIVDNNDQKLKKSAYYYKNSTEHEINSQFIWETLTICVWNFRKHEGTCVIMPAYKSSSMRVSLNNKWKKYVFFTFFQLKYVNLEVSCKICYSVRRRKKFQKIKWTLWIDDSFCACCTAEKLWLYWLVFPLNFSMRITTILSQTYRLICLLDR